MEDTSMMVFSDLKSCVNDFCSSFCLEIDREYNSDDYQNNYDADHIDHNIKDRTVAARNKQLMIFIKDRIKNCKP